MPDQQTSDEQITVTDNEAAHQFEARVDGQLARLVYDRDDHRVVYFHTEVPDSIGRRGIGSLLVRAGLDDARARGLRVVPSCPFVHAYIRRHPEYRDLTRA
jgi:predicted GNAT family acetyltransferase